jgi:single-stranded-DNA-specific exonuclease
MFDSFGGHEQAVGFTVTAERLKELRKDLQQAALEMLQGGNFVVSAEADCELEFKDMDELFFRSYEKLEPFGIGNPRPVFLARDVRVKTNPVPRGESFKFYAENSGLTYEIYWRPCEHRGLKSGDLVDIFFTVDRGYLRGEGQTILKARHILKTSEK